MLKCKVCKWKYPEELVSPMVASVEGKSSQVMMCGICAEKVMGSPLQGQIAKYMRDEAIKHRKDNPKDGPNEFSEKRN